MTHDNDSLPEIQKYHYLKSCLSGEDGRLVGSLPITTKNYTTAMHCMTNSIFLEGLMC
jgi:hypothetical protein